jgi:peptidyl-prolyl cis-trans isomerase C
MSTAFFPAIVVNGTTLPAADIAAEAQNHHAPKGKPGLAWRKAARALAVRHLMLEEAAQMGLTATSAEVAPGQFETPDEALIRELLDTTLTPAQVTELDLRAVYDRDPSQHRAPTLYQASHILYAAKPGDAPARDEARLHSEAALKSLLQSPRNFANIARSDSACSSRDADGQLGQLCTGDTVPEFEAALKIATIGEIHPTPVETRYGFHILRLDARAEGAILPFEAVRENLYEASEKAQWAKAAQAYVTALLTRATIDGLDINIAA